MDDRIRDIEKKDAEIILNAFRAQGWNKPIKIYLDYLKEHEKDERKTLVAEINGDFAGYVTIKLKSDYKYFLENNIPEIMDFNVLLKYRGKGVGNKLMDRAEEIVKTNFELVGIGVGLFSDYGTAQRMYVKRDYIPDGKGIQKNNICINYGDTIIIDDDLVLYFIKELK